MFTLKANSQLPKMTSACAEIADQHDDGLVGFFCRNVQNLPQVFHAAESQQDDENDVVFVKEYQQTSGDGQRSCLRRNPVRKVRKTKRGFHLQNEHLLEEDFGILDQLDEVSLVMCKREQTPAKEPLKTWPINAYERPEYNPSTNQVEPLDCVMKNSETHLKKPKLTVPRKAKAKPKKKYHYQPRKRSSTVPKAPEMVAASELKPLVQETLKMVQELTAGPFGKKYGLELLNNQTTLLAIIAGREDQGDSSAGPSSKKRK